MVASEDTRVEASLAAAGRARAHDLDAPRIHELKRRLFGAQAADDPVRLGRYVVLRRIGAGGIGIVYEAYDAELDRKVALKILRPLAADATATPAQARLLREARALAKLSHPNVVTVYEVGTHEHEVFLALELVAGMTLAEWLAAERRSWREVVRVFIDAGRGLAAAHAAGIIHRDFKPANVLVGDDGRVRVLDFGLAYFVDRGEVARDVSASPDLPGSSDGTLTLPNVAMGTPACMAPEQHGAGTPDVRTDVYNFCASLFEGVYRRRPFEGTLVEIVERKRSGRVDVPSSSPVPGWVERAIVRGLAVDPAQRHASMDELLDELSLERRRRRAIAWTIAGGTLALGAIVWQAWRSDGPVCDSGAAQMEGVWDTAVVDEVKVRFAAPALSYGDEAFASVSASLTRYATTWTDAHRSVCEATHVRGEQSPELLDRRMFCLEQRRAHLRGVVSTLRGADERVIEHAVEIVESIPPVDPCLGDPATVAMEPSVEERAAAVAFEESYARAVAVRVASSTDEYAAAVEEILETARASGRREEQARALVLRATVQDLRGEYDAAEQTALAAVAMAAGSDGAFATPRAWIILVEIATKQARFDAAERYAEIARESLREVDQRSLGPSVDRALGLLYFTTSRYDDATAALERALADIADPDGTEASTLYYDLANMAARNRDFERATELYERALAITVAKLGPHHPRMVAALGGLGVLANMRGDPATAERHLRAAQAVLDGLRVPDDLYAAGVHQNLGNALFELGRLPEALQAYRRAAAVFEQVLGPEHPDLGFALTGVGRIELRLGERAAARTTLERALAIRDRPTTDRNEVADTLFELAKATGPDDPARAHALARRARDILEIERADPGVAEELDAWLAAHDAASAG